jgi:hypothetical protein
MTFRPRRRSHVLTECKIARSDELSGRIDGAGIDTAAYDPRYGFYRLQLRAEDLDANEALMKELMLRASGTPVAETVGAEVASEE